MLPLKFKSYLYFSRGLKPFGLESNLLPLGMWPADLRSKTPRLKCLNWNLCHEKLYHLFYIKVDYENLNLCNLKYFFKTYLLGCSENSCYLGKLIRTGKLYHLTH